MNKMTIWEKIDDKWITVAEGDPIEEIRQIARKYRLTMIRANENGVSYCTDYSCCGTLDRLNNEGHYIGEEYKLKLYER